MNQAPHITSKPQMALQSYLDGLLQEATEPFELPPAQDAPVAQPAEQAPGDEFEAAVREEQARDASARSRQRRLRPAHSPSRRPRSCRPCCRPPRLSWNRWWRS